MARELHQRYPPLSTAPGRARHHLAEYLGDHGLQDLVPVAALLVSELVTNSLIHAGGLIDVHARLSAESLRVEVGDGSERLPQRRVPDRHGRGLHIVDSLATAWGVVPHDGRGKSTWFELQLA
jgi:two-component sensor histidine kinase